MDISLTVNLWWVAGSAIYLFIGLLIAMIYWLLNAGLGQWGQRTTTLQFLGMMVFWLPVILFALAFVIIMPIIEVFNVFRKKKNAKPKG